MSPSIKKRAELNKKKPEESYLTILRRQQEENRAKTARLRALRLEKEAAEPNAVDAAQVRRQRGKTQ